MLRIHAPTQQQNYSKRCVDCIPSLANTHTQRERERERESLVSETCPTFSLHSGTSGVHPTFHLEDHLDRIRLVGPLGLCPVDLAELPLP